MTVVMVRPLCLGIECLASKSYSVFFSLFCLFFFSPSWLTVGLVLSYYGAVDSMDRFMGNTVFGKMTVVTLAKTLPA